MSSSNARTAILFAALTATSLAFVTPASALDFNKPQDKRVYCQVYATQALSDVHASQARGCGFSGTSWSGTFDDHFNWCLSQGDMAATVQENVARSSAVQADGNGSVEASFPPVVDDTAAQADTKFPPVVANEPAAAGDEKPAAQTSFPPVADAPAPVRTSSATPPPVADADEPAVEEARPPTVTSLAAARKPARSRSGSLSSVASTRSRSVTPPARLRRRSKRSCRISRTITTTTTPGQSLRGKVKDALKGALQRRLASR